MTSIKIKQVKKIILGSSLLLLMACAVTKKNKPMLQFAKNPVVAHRGAFKKNGFPENSIASLKEAIRLGCAGSEFDVHMTADDSLVINHDPHYYKLEIEKTPYALLAQTRLANGEKLPTLREYLLAGMEKNTQTRLVLEIKPSGISKERGRLVAEKVQQLVRELKADPWVVYISFDYGILKRIHELTPGAGTQYLNGELAPDKLKADGINGADYHFSVFRKNPDWITIAKQQGIILNAWTVNDSETMDWLLGAGFDFITTNEPELLLQKSQSR